MNKSTLTFLTALILFGLAVTFVAFGHKGDLPRQLRHLCERRMADARTVGEALRYLATPELTPLEPRTLVGAIAATNLPEFVPPSASPLRPGLTNLADLAVSNGIATRTADRLVPG